MTAPLFTAAELAADQALAESLMVDTCTIRRPTGQTEPNPVTMQLEVTYEPGSVYSGKCRVREKATIAAKALSGLGR